MTILVTGARGGIGSAIANELIKTGMTVISVDIENIDEPDYHKVDISDADAVMRLKHKIGQDHDKIDVIIHAAGTLEIGALIEVSASRMNRVLQLNLMGVYHINYAFTDMISSGGKIIMISSETGWQTPAPLNGPYAISKHALEAYSDALRRELAFLDIKVIKVQPGAIRTSMTLNVEERFQELESSTKYFKRQVAKGRRYLPKTLKNALNPDELSTLVLSIIRKKRPKSTYRIGSDKLRSMLERLPISWQDWIIRKSLS